MTNSATAITNGLFTVTLDPGPGVFTGAERWLEIAVRTNGGGAFVALAPRQELTATPYAIWAAGATTASSVPAAGIGSGTANINISGYAMSAISAASAGSAATAATAANFTGPLAGDVTGTQGATTVERLRGTQVSSTPPATNQHLRFDGTRWTPNAVQLDTDVSGTLADARLTTNVALLNKNQFFIGSNVFSGVVTATNPANVFNGTFAGGGGGLTGLNASSLSGGILSDARLSTNVALLNGSANFSGTVTADAFQGNGAMPWVVTGDVSGESAASPNTAYLLTNAGQAIVTLPDTANVGDVVRVSGVGADGWVFNVPNNSQSIAGANAFGLFWRPCADYRNWRSVATSDDGKKLVAVEYGGQIYTSTDSGATWTARENNRNWSSVASSADGTKLVAVAHGGQIYTSIDSGASWTPRENNRNWGSVASSADGTRLAAGVAMYGQVYISSDSGATWTAHGDTLGWCSLASSADGLKLVAADYGETGGYLYTSTDAGATWTARESRRNWASVATSADGTKLVAAEMGGQIYTSTDSGATWTARETSRSWKAVASSADGTKLAAAEIGGQIYTTTDSGATWTPRENDRGWISVASSSGGTKLVAAEEGGPIYVSSASLTGGQGATAALQYIGNGVWQPLAESQIAGNSVGSGQLASSLAISGTMTAGSFQGNGALPWQVTGGTNALTSPNTAYLLTNAAQSIVTLPTTAGVGDVVRVSGVGAGGWVLAPNIGQSIAGANAYGLAWIPCAGMRSWQSVASSADGVKLVAVAPDDRIYTSPDAGATWTARESSRVWWSAASSADGTKLVALDNGGRIYTSTNSGLTWTPRETNRYWTAVASSTNGTKLVAVASGDQIYTSTDSGATWTPHESARWWYSVASSSDGTKLVAVVQGDQIFTSTDSGTTWTPRETSRNWQAVASSANGTKLVALEYDGQIYTSTNSGATWTARENNRGWVSVASSADGTKLVAVDSTGADYSGGQVYVSTDSGATWTPRASNRIWVSVASSTDGTELVAAEQGGQIYISNPALNGDQGTTAALQYIGNGVWQPLAESQIAGSSVGSAQLAPNLAISGTMGAAVFSGSGSGLTNLNAGALSSGTLADARLSTNVALLNANQKFTASNIFSGMMTATNAANIIGGNGSALTGLTPANISSGTANINISGNASTVINGIYSTGSYNDPAWLASLAASKITGTLADTRLSSNVALLTTNQTFTASNRFSGVLTATNAANIIGGNGSALTGLTPANISSGTANINISGNASTVINGIYSTGSYNDPAWLASLAASKITGTLPDARLSANVALLNQMQTYSGSPNFLAPPVFSWNSGAPFTVYSTNWVANLNADMLDGLHTNDLARATHTHTAADLTSGTLADARLSTNVPLLNANQQTFTASNLFSGVVTATNPANVFAGTFAGNGAGLTNILYWQSVSGTAQQAQPNSRYLATNAAQVTITLPASPVLGDTLRVSGPGSSGWKIAQNPGQTIVAVNPGWISHDSSRGWYSAASSSDGVKLAVVVYGGQIYTSSDSGISWTPHETGRNWQAIAGSADGTKLVAVINNGFIYTSADSGATWVQRGSSLWWSSVASSADGAKLVAATAGDRIYTSTDSGTNWTAHDSYRNWRDIASSADGTKLVAAVNGGYLYTSTDSGTNWTQSGSNLGWQSVASSADGTRLVAVVSGGQIYSSGDSGLSWTPRESNRNWQSVASSADGSTLLAVVNGGRIYVSNDYGSTWTPRELSRNWTSAASSSDGTKLVAAEGGGFIYTCNSGTVTTTSTTGTSGYLLGDQYSTIELQYIGNNLFMPLSSAGLIFAY